MKSKIKSPNGQALVEFALMITVVLMLIFLIIEASRIMWGWVTVQNAAREGIRYAITGQFMGADCPISDLPKYSYICDAGDQTALRTASIISTTHTGLSGLPLNEASGIMEDEYYYLIQVWGANQQNQLVENFGGAPAQPVIVRVTYRIPIISPFFSSILPSIPVVGQVTEYNENFGQLGNPSGQGLPPDVSDIPTPGPTPSPTNTPTPDPDPDPSATPSLTPTDTPPPSPTPDICNTQFVENPLQNQPFALVMGEVDELVTLINLTTGQTLATNIVLNEQPSPGRECDGFTNFNNALDPLVAGHILLVQSSNGTFDTTIVLGGTATPTPSPTHTIAPTNTPTPIPTETSTPTPSGPFIDLRPSCAPGPSFQFNISGANWPDGSNIALYWNTNNLILTIPANQHGGSFSRQVQRNNINNGAYQVVAIASTGETATAVFDVPCPGSTPIPTTTATATGTPAPADLIVIGPPELISTPPIVAYQPVQYRVVISNTGDINVNQQFFIDLYLDPGEVLTTSIPLVYSSGYQGVGGLSGRASRVLSITAPLGFANDPEDHMIYAMVDSLEQVNEEFEDNNISTPAFYNQVTPAATPTPTATPDDGANYISGVVRGRIGGNWVPQHRAAVALIDNSTSQVVRTEQTDGNGFYEFLDIPDGTYSVVSCIEIDNTEYTGTRTGLEVPESNGFVDIFLLEGPCS